MANSSQHRILIIGGGSAGITVAARLRRAGQSDIGLIEPSDKHYYQPLWTLVGGGCAPAPESERSEAALIPKGVSWIHDAAVEVDPDNRTRQHAGWRDSRLRLPGRRPWHPARLGQDPGSRPDARAERGLEQLPLRPRPQDLGVPEGAARRHCRLHHAGRAHQVSRRAAEDRVSGGSLLAATRHPQGHPRGARHADTRDVLCARVRGCPSPGRRALRDRRATQDRDDRRRPRRQADHAGESAERDRGDLDPGLRRTARSSPAERPGLGEEEPPGNERAAWVRRDRQVQHAARPLAQRLCAGRRGRLTELQDRGRDPQPGSRRREQPARRDGWQGAAGPLRGLLVLPAHDRPATRCCSQSSTTR